MLSHSFCWTFCLPVLLLLLLLRLTLFLWLNGETMINLTATEDACMCVTTGCTGKCVHGRRWRTGLVSTVTHSHMHTHSIQEQQASTEDCSLIWRVFICSAWMQLPEFYWNWQQHDTSDLVEIGGTTAILMPRLWKDFYERSRRQRELRLCWWRRSLHGSSRSSSSSSFLEDQIHNKNSSWFSCNLHHSQVTYWNLFEQAWLFDTHLHWVQCGVEYINL